jgi:hypothetical protein
MPVSGAILAVSVLIKGFYNFFFSLSTFSNVLQLLWDYGCPHTGS